ncbi:hypothetical protein CXG81DRAFT_1983, partial [Caulochytrium protostelioides]
PRVAIVGGGLVGALGAVYFARRGWTVDVYDLRRDLRREAQDAGRSINLALSRRGMEAMERVGLDPAAVATLLPLRGRMLHPRRGPPAAQPYGEAHEHIHSVDRHALNVRLLDEADRWPNVTLHFQRKLVGADLDAGTLTLEDRFDVTADLILGADGAYSRVRQCLMRRVHMDYHQTYMDHCWIELSIPAMTGAAPPVAPVTPQGHALSAAHLHIWPRHTFMLIALPNADGSFTATLFLPWADAARLTTRDAVLAFFQTEFPDAVPLMGADALATAFLAHPRGPLMGVQCRPYHYADRVLILGDAAHAMVPFYGQGMNCGFEDLSVLDRLLTQHCGPVPPPAPAGAVPGPATPRAGLGAALAAYSATRHADCVAICDLAARNYDEMRHRVVSWRYQLRKRVEAWLHRLMPETVIPLYTMVSFTSIPYSEVIRRDRRQGWWLQFLGVALALGAV